VANRKRTRPAPEREPRFLGWKTTDEDEVERRRWRGRSETAEVVPLVPADGPFGAWRVRSAGGGEYVVEIRHLNARENSCGCRDFATNGLGTCKHIEGALIHLRRRKALAGLGRMSPRIEVFVSGGEEPGPRVQWPENPSLKVQAVRPHVEKHLAALRAARPEALDALRGIAGEAPASLRLSRTLDAWLEEQRRAGERVRRRAAFLAEAETGRASLDVVNLPLLPYQQDGMLHLAFGERALLADEMGLGKTVQAVAACELLRRLGGIRRVLVVSPASLKAEWEEQVARFTDLATRIVSGARPRRLAAYAEPAFFTLANYEQVVTDAADINRILAPDVVILDEAQRIKNWQTKTARAVKSLESPYAFVLTGTPLENRIDEIYSIVQFLDPRLLGPLFRFNRDYYELDERGRPTDYKNLARLNERLAPVMLRRRKDQVEDQLPGRTVTNYFVGMTAEQRLRYEEYEAPVARLLQAARRRSLTKEEFDRLQLLLGCMRMTCDSPYILDPACRDAPKIEELERLLADLLQEDGTRKIIVFSEWVRMLELARELAQDAGVDFAWHTGSVPQDRRREEILRFKKDPACRLFLSSESGGVGLNLQVADTVINLDLPWNPARLEQRIARAWRKHQTRAVTVVNLVCEDSIEHRILHLLEQKQGLADGVLDGRGDLAAIKMPSGRAAFLERMQALMEAKARPAAPDPFEWVRDELAERLGGGFLRMEVRRDGIGKEAAMVVVGDPAAARAALGAPPPGLETLPELEVIDAATFATLRRLEQAGILRFTGIEPRILHQAAERDEAAERRAQARDLRDRADHRLRMATLLAGGGFAEEARAPAVEAAALALRALALLAGRPDPGEGSSLSALADALAAETRPELAHPLAVLTQEAAPPDEYLAAARAILAAAHRAARVV
jgi:HEPN domain-containing protein